MVISQITWKLKLRLRPVDYIQFFSFYIIIWWFITWKIRSWMKILYSCSCCYSSKILFFENFTTIASQSAYIVCPSLYGDYRPLWYNLWCCGCLWSDLLTFILCYHTEMPIEKSCNYQSNEYHSMKVHSIDSVLCYLYYIFTQSVPKCDVNRSYFHPPTVKLWAVDWSTIQFWNFLAKGHST